jgi:type VI secretion system secreted protein Hcp
VAINMYLQIPNIKGGVATSGFVGALDVLAFSWGASNPTVAAQTPGSGSAKPSVQDLSITTFQDTATSPLIAALLKGALLAKVVLTVVYGASTTGPAPVSDVYTMNDVIVSSASLGGSGGEDHLTVNYSFNFAALNFKISGKPVTWNIGTNGPF